MAGIIEVKDQGKVRIYDADNSNYIDIVVPSTVSSNRTITIPDASFTIPTANTTYSVGDGGLTTNDFTDADHTKLDGIAASANNYVHPNHSGEVTSTADGATVIADNIVDEANLKISNSPTNGYFLSAQSGNTGGLTWAEASGGTNTPNFEVRKTSGNQSLSNNTYTKVNFESETFDSDNAFDISNEKFTVPSGKGGKYFLYACVKWNNDDRGIRKVAFYKNGSLEKEIFDQDGHDQGSQMASSGAILNLSAGDYIELFCLQSTADPENIIADGEATYFGGYKLIE